MATAPSSRARAQPLASAFSSRSFPGGCSRFPYPRPTEVPPYAWEGEEEATGLPSDVSRGHFAVYVGERRCRFVVPIALLDRPEFRYLLWRAKEEFGFAGAGGTLVLPCEEVAFRSLTSALACTR
ncbi:auxin-responsive protein SAUR50 [Zea mays]|uniref:SAUR-like auxin-responsive protein family n=1 Tax=Zea mays TaxID=4577 RepID=A0A1D6EGD6_MAIZE|nr:auxin-responsive protein SAUR50 [Zea mays]ONM19232.1 SAUR-like auxin-responsive protein family [Zea mays]|eukprot:XP_008664494.1 auxin-responsive protein SAUR50 [Zea mays]